MHNKNADNVLPEPVGAAINVSSPRAIAGQPSACACVGPCGKRRSNQVRTAGWNSANAASPCRCSWLAGSASRIQGKPSLIDMREALRGRPPLASPSCKSAKSAAASRCCGAVSERLPPPGSDPGRTATVGGQFCDTRAVLTRSIQRPRSGAAGALLAGDSGAGTSRYER